MNSFRIATSSSILAEAEKIVEAENQHLTADDKKRRLIGFRLQNQLPTSVAAGVVSVADASGENDTPDPGVDSAGDIIRSSPSTVVASGHLSALDTTSNVFLRHAGPVFNQKFFDLANKYELLNSDGALIFYAGETLERFGGGRAYGYRSQFDVTVLLPDGTPVLNVVAHKGITTVSDFQKVLGSVIDLSTVFSQTRSFSIRDWNMCEVFRLKRSANGTLDEYDIVSANEPMKLGQFTNNWSVTVPNYIGVDKLYGISFPLDMCTEEKVLIFGSLFVLYFLHLHEGVAGVEKKRKFYLFCICILIGLLLVIGSFVMILLAVLRD